MPEWFVWTVKYCVKYSQASAENRVHLALKKNWLEVAYDSIFCEFKIFSQNIHRIYKQHEHVPHELAFMLE
jgi:hypothetical protein